MRRFLLLLLLVIASSQTTDLLISEYIEGFADGTAAEVSKSQQDSGSRPLKNVAKHGKSMVGIAESVTDSAIPG